MQVLKIIARGSEDYVMAEYPVEGAKDLKVEINDYSTGGGAIRLPNITPVFVYRPGTKIIIQIEERP